MNNPIRFNDPSGHVVCEVGEPCGPGATYVAETSYEQMNVNLKKKIKDKYGITLSDEGDKSWTVTNILIMYSSLYNVNNSLNGQLRSIIGDGVIYKMFNQDPNEGVYHGVTHLDGSGIQFFTLGNNLIPKMNIYHEMGHLLDNTTALKNVFTTAVNGAGAPSWIRDGFINPGALKYQTVGGVPAIQAYNRGSSEEWADAFANYVAGNIDLSDPNGPGTAMHTFVTGALGPYIGTR